MRDNACDVSYWEDVWATTHIPQEVTRETIPELHQVFSDVLPAGHAALIEVGCAPGGWLAYFHKTFHCTVSGVEYAPAAYEKTVENLRALNVPNELFCTDFFRFEHSPYDIVFSMGFIEHFRDTEHVVKGLYNLCRPAGGMVMTVVPCMEGVNWWISRTFRPRVAALHFPITREQLKACHERCGLQTVCCRYVGAFQILQPVAKNDFARKHSLASSIMNFPFRVWNCGVKALKSRICWYPEWRSMAESIVYIGRRPA